MRATYIILAVFSLLGLGQATNSSLPLNFPTCALACFPANFGGSSCMLPDLPCFCAQNYFILYWSSCLYVHCNEADELIVQDYTISACQLQHDDRRPEAITVPAVFLSLSLAFVILRLIERPPFTHSFYLDDMFIVVAMAMMIPMSFLCIYATRFGFGLKQFEVTVENLEHGLKVYYVAQILYISINAATKLSVLSLYLRVFQNRRFKLEVLVVMALTAAYGISFVFVTIFQCTPVDYYWTQWNYTSIGTCMDHQAYLYSSSGLNILLDIVTIILPIRQVVSLNLTFVQKVQIVGMFGLGFFITVASSVRLALYSKIIDDFTYDYVYVVTWNSVEVGTAIICACLPVVAGMVRRFRKNLTVCSRGAHDSRISSPGFEKKNLGQVQILPPEAEERRGRENARDVEVPQSDANGNQKGS